MSDGEDFQWVIGKVPSFDLPGIEHSGAHLGTGGLRHEDGRLSSLVSDLRAISPEEADQLRDPLDDQTGTDGVQAVAAIAVGVAAVAVAGVYAVRSRNQIAEQVSSRVTEPLKDKLRQLRRNDEPAPAPESRQLDAPAEVPAELQGILDQTKPHRASDTWGSFRL